MQKKWIQWIQEMQAIAQTGLEYSRDKFDLERFQQLRDLSINILHEYTEIDHAKLRDLFANENGYQTPKVDIRVVIYDEDKILFTKEKDDGKWSLPGGWADINLSVRENAIKEVHEEAGIEVEPQNIIAILDRAKYISDDYPYSVYKIFVECDYIKGSFRDNLETSDAKFFSLDELPELSTGRITLEQVKICFVYKNQKNPALVFD